MKKNLITLALLLTVAVSSSFASGPRKGDDNIKESFRREFRDAQIMKWDNFKAYARATFRMNDQVMFAYYSGNGELLAIARNILSDRLPLNLMQEIKNNYSGYWITELFEVTAQGETSYYVTLENPDYKLVLQAADSTGWTTFQKQNKNKE